MQHILLWILLFLYSFEALASWSPLYISEKQIEGKTSISTSAFILEDKNNDLAIGDILSLKDAIPEKFTPIKEEILNLNFTTSYYWVAFKIKNDKGTVREYFIEAAIPVTNKVDLYTLNANNDLDLKKGGDEISFFSRTIKHRKNLFKIRFEPGEEKSFYLHLKSDGEVLKLPLIIWESEALINKDYKDQYILGGYYGILLFVFIFFLFFYIALKKNTFLYYLLYIFCLFTLQLSLDGLSFQYLWPDNTWLSSHAVAICADLSIFFIISYAMSYLNLKKTLPYYYRVFRVFLLACVLIFILCFTGEKLFAITYPAINVTGLVSTLLILATIITARLKHQRVNLFFSLAFASIIIGSTIFILSNFNIIENTIFTEHALKFGSAFEVIFLSLSMAMRYREIQKEKNEAQANALEKLKEMNKLKDELNASLDQQVKERLAEHEIQKAELTQKNRDITDSINYAKRIQQAILPDEKFIAEVLPDSFVINKPKDIVSGDFFFIEPIRTNDGVKLTGFAVADSTGHGVPGALISILGTSFLKQSLTEKTVNSPAEALDFISNKITMSLRQKENGEIKDGMDMAFCVINYTTLELYYSGAYNPLWIVRKGETLEQDPPASAPNFILTEIKADKQPIGYFETAKPFTNHKIKLAKGDTMYIFSDGYADQFGGPQGKKFKSSRFKELLVSIQDQSMEKQKEILLDTLHQWQGDLEQVDDICIIGVRV